MSKKPDALEAFMDRNAPIVFDALKADNTAHFHAVMDRVMQEFLNVNIPQRKTRAAPKRKVRRGIGSY